MNSKFYLFAYFLCICICLLQSVKSEIKYHPIILIHGINNTPRSWNEFIKAIHAVRPPGSGRIIELTSPFDGIPGSWIDLNTQLSWFKQELKLLCDFSPAEFDDGFDLVCHSQGAVVCQALIQDSDILMVRSFISLAGPHLGVFGDMWFEMLPSSFRNFLLDSVWNFAYEDWAQRSLSPANLWHDPWHPTEFLLKNLFLPKFLGLTGTEEERLRRKKNFLKLKRASYLVGNFSEHSHDKGIDPWFSGIFSFYDDFGNLVSHNQQILYTEDTFGLRSLDENGKLHLFAVPNVFHDDWLYDHYVIREYVYPLLSPPLPNHG